MICAKSWVEYLRSAYHNQFYSPRFNIALSNVLIPVSSAMTWVFVPVANKVLLKRRTKIMTWHTTKCIKYLMCM